jgi:hypothetical protein
MMWSEIAVRLSAEYVEMIGQKVLISKLPALVTGLFY